MLLVIFLGAFGLKLLDKHVLVLSFVALVFDEVLIGLLEHTELDLEFAKDERQSFFSDLQFLVRQHMDQVSVFLPVSILGGFSPWFDYSLSESA